MSTNSNAPGPEQRALREAIAQATLAPSVGNTQPWRWVAQPSRLELYVDHDRALRRQDPDGRDLLLSCGAALLFARIALQARGFSTQVELLPAQTQPDLLAAVGVSPTAAPDVDAQRLDAVIADRHTNRRDFVAGVDDALVRRMAAAAAQEGTWLWAVTTPHDRVAVTVLMQHAEAVQQADPGYRAELRHWSDVDADRRDGIPAASIPQSPGDISPNRPLRDFDVRGEGELPAQDRTADAASYFVLGTDADSRRERLLAGQALGRVLLEITAAGAVASPVSSLTEWPSLWVQTRSLLGLQGCMHIVLRVGRAAPTPATPRRAVTSVLAEFGGTDDGR
jgi:hypothetical protein